MEPKQNIAPGEDGEKVNQNRYLEGPNITGSSRINWVGNIGSDMMAIVAKEFGVKGGRPGRKLGDFLGRKGGF